MTNNIPLIKKLSKLNRLINSLEFTMHTGKTNEVVAFHINLHIPTIFARFKNPSS